MKKKFRLIVSGLSFCLASICIGQEITVAEPDFEGEIIYTSIEGDIQALEYQTASVKTKASVGLQLTGIGKVRQRVSVRGNQSTTILPANQTLHFVYNHGDNIKNPKNLIQLVRFYKKGKNRVAEIASVSGTSGEVSSGDIDFLTFGAKKYGTLSYLVSVSNLEPGHYAFFVGEDENANAHLFSIDGFDVKKEKKKRKKEKTDNDK